MQSCAPFNVILVKILAKRNVQVSFTVLLYSTEQFTGFSEYDNLGHPLKLSNAYTIFRHLMDSNSRSISGGVLPLIPSSTAFIDAKSGTDTVVPVILGVVQVSISRTLSIMWGKPDFLKAIRQRLPEVHSCVSYHYAKEPLFLCIGTSFPHTKTSWSVARPSI